MSDRSPRRHTARLTLIVAALVGASALAPMAGQDDAALQLLRQSLARHQAASMEYAGALVTTSRGGAERRKTWRSFRQGVGAAAHRLIVFLAPAEVRGVAYLSRGRADGPADQWLYLPSMRRERRLAEPDRDVRFAGTDFTFEDLQELDPAGYRVSQLADEMVAGEPAVQLRLVSLRPSAYQDETLCLRRTDLMLLARRSRRHGEATASKTLTLTDFTVVEGRTVARRIEMADAVRGSKTVLHLSEIRFDRPQPPDRFTVSGLPRAGVQ